jgi:hypothetical protein
MHGGWLQSRGPKDWNGARSVTCWPLFVVDFSLASCFRCRVPVGWGVEAPLISCSLQSCFPAGFSAGERGGVCDARTAGLSYPRVGSQLGAPRMIHRSVMCGCSWLCWSEADWAVWIKGLFCDWLTPKYLAPFLPILSLLTLSLLL